MRWLGAALAKVLGLFVADWTQTFGVLGILAAGWAATRLLHFESAGFLVALLLAGLLVYTTLAETRKRRPAAVVEKGEDTDRDDDVRR